MSRDVDLGQADIFLGTMTPEQCRRAGIQAAKNADTPAELDEWLQMLGLKQTPRRAHR